MKKFDRIFLIVMDSFGIGNAKDAAEYGDTGANTFLAVSSSKKLNVPNMEKLGFGQYESKGLQSDSQLAYTARLDEISNGKDTLTGHWEYVGIKTEVSFVTFTETGFPKELLDELSAATGRKIVGNKSSSGTVILDEFGEHHMETGDMIVYTSSDSVLQICGHEETMGLDDLYAACEAARKICDSKPEWKVGRIIARPFLGDKAGEFKRTSNRHDYAVVPPTRSTLDELKDSGFDSIAIGKINDIFTGVGITKVMKGKNDSENMDKTIECAKGDFSGLAFTNLVDFDALYGHRRNVLGYAENTELFDVKLGELLEVVRENDLIILTADHGNDPSFPGSDHTREQIPFVMYSKSLKEPKELGTFNSFATIGNLIADNFGVNKTKYGESMIDKLI